MSTLRSHLEEALRDLQRKGLKRGLLPPSGVDFSSNDYLGLARLPEFRDRLMQRLGESPPASPASRLLAGNLPEHEELEEKLAVYKGTESALIFSTGYQANLGVLTALIGAEDRVLSDELNHASIIDGLRLTRASRIIYPHLDLSVLQEALTHPHPAGRTFVVTESLFSMDGDIADLGRIADLTHRHGASLIVDDAHAVGVYGQARGSGLLEHFGVERKVDAVISTFGKALGFFGAFVSGPTIVIDWLINRARSFIFTTACPPAVLCGMETSIELASGRPDLRSRVLNLADRARDGLARRGFDCLLSAGPIVPVIIGDNKAAVDSASALRDRGFDVRAIRPPSVSPGTARLRISVHADHTEQNIDDLVDAIADVTPAPT